MASDPSDLNNEDMVDLPKQEEIDQLSNLPEFIILKILSFLPVHKSAQTSMLARRYRYLWTATPTLTLSRILVRRFNHFLDIGHYSFLRRDPVAPLEQLNLDTGRDKYFRPIPPSQVAHWLVRATVLGLRRLFIKIHFETLVSVFNVIFEIHGLESLVVKSFSFRRTHALALPPVIFLNNLKHLNLSIEGFRSEDITRLVAELPSLEELILHKLKHVVINLVSRNLKKLVLSSIGEAVMSFSFPQLESLVFDSSCQTLMSAGMKSFQGWMPLLNKAIIKFSNVCQGDVPAISDFLKSLSNVNELTLAITASLYNLDPFDFSWDTEEPFPRIQSQRKFSLLWDPAKVPPTFPNMKMCSFSACFDEHTLKDIVTLIEHSPTLGCLRMINLGGVLLPPILPKPNSRALVCLQSSEMRNNLVKLLMQVLKYE